MAKEYVCTNRWYMCALHSLHAPTQELRLTSNVSNRYFSFTNPHVRCFWYFFLSIWKKSTHNHTDSMRYLLTSISVRTFATECIPFKQHFRAHKTNGKNRTRVDFQIFKEIHVFVDDTIPLGVFIGIYDKICVVCANSQFSFFLFSIR